MYSVNVDKLVKTSETQAESLLEITDNIIEGLGNHKAFAVLGGKVDTFKIAYNIMYFLESISLARVRRVCLIILKDLRRMKK